MGFLKFLFGKPLVVQDAFFGRLRWVGESRSAVGYFEGERFFSGAGSTIEVQIEAPETGPSQEQRQFFQWLEHHYLPLVQASAPLITERFREWLPHFYIQNFQGEFTPVFLTIPPEPLRPAAEWEIAFETVHDHNHTVTVGYRAACPVFVYLDG